MAETEKEEKKQGFTLDWLIGGVLSKFGETVDRFTGRGWNPSSSLATSKLVEKLKFLLDEEVKDFGTHRRFAPHKITLKMQWNKFAADLDDDIEALKTELHAAAIDHINDRLYHTYAPIEIEIKTDYFTEGVRLIGSFGKFGDDDEEAAVNVTLPNIKIEETLEGIRASIDLVETPVEVEAGPSFSAVFSVNGIQKTETLDFSEVKRFSVGREKSSGLAIADQSVSKAHASIVIGSGGNLMVADTGSTNGTYISQQRIPYGKAVEILNGSVVRFGTVDVKFETERELDVEPAPEAEVQLTEQIEIKPAAEAGQIAKPTVAFSDEATPPQEVSPATDEWSEFTDVETDVDESVKEEVKSREDWEL